MYQSLSQEEPQIQDKALQEKIKEELYRQFLSWYHPKMQKNKQYLTIQWNEFRYFYHLIQME